jgi:hypothetical protein
MMSVIIHKLCAVTRLFFGIPYKRAQAQRCRAERRGRSTRSEGEPAHKRSWAPLAHALLMSAAAAEQGLAARSD